jgi:hypothetical protein
MILTGTKLWKKSYKLQASSFKLQAQYINIVDNLKKLISQYNLIALLMGEQFQNFAFNDY